MRSVHRFRFFLLAAIALRVVPVAFGAQSDPEEKVTDRIVARVNKTAIMLSEVQDAVRRTRDSDPRFRLKNNSASYKESLQSLIDQELLFQEAERRGIEVPEETIARKANAMAKELQVQYGSQENLEAALKAQNVDFDELLEQYSRKEEREMKIGNLLRSRLHVSDAEIEAYANELREKGESADAYHLCHILIRLPTDASDQEVESAHERAKEVVQKVEAGMTFSEAAQRYSGHELTQLSGGDLGFVEQGSMVAELEEAASKLEIGQSSPPIRSDEGFYILYLEDKRTAKSMIYSQRLDEEKTQWIEELRRTATIEVSENFLSGIDDSPLW